MRDRVPFSNGAEGEAWMMLWCEHCVHDHDISHDAAGSGPGCELILAAMMGGDDWRWPEAWLEPPPSVRRRLPALMLCGMFEPCHLDDCTGDPLAETRVEIVSFVKATWEQERSSPEV
jgi:hypothetical protein